jgi:hypothetical protein
VGGTRGRFKKSSVYVREILDLEDFTGRLGLSVIVCAKFGEITYIGAELGESTI